MAISSGTENLLKLAGAWKDLPDLDEFGGTRRAVDDDGIDFDLGE